MGRHNNFDGLRLIGALLVLFSHMFALSGRYEPRFLAGHSYGNLGVLIFFSISGYLITASWARDPDLGRFLAKRFLRMAPALAVSIPLSAAVVYMLGLWRFPGNEIHLLNGSLWTIPYEVLCYFVLAGLSMLTRHTLLLMALGALIVADQHSVDWIVRHCASFGLFFAVGGLLYQYPRLLKWTPAMLALGLWIALGRYDIWIGLALIVPPLAVLAGTRSWWPLNQLGRIGDLSYGIYIYAWPVQQLVVYYIGKDVSYLQLLLPSLVITSLLAFGSWHFVERRALSRKPLLAALESSTHVTHAALPARSGERLPDFAVINDAGARSVAD